MRVCRNDQPGDLATISRVVAGAKKKRERNGRYGVMWSGRWRGRDRRDRSACTGDWEWGRSEGGGGCCRHSGRAQGYSYKRAGTTGVQLGRRPAWAAARGEERLSYDLMQGDEYDASIRTRGRTARVGVLLVQGQFESGFGTTCAPPWVVVRPRCGDAALYCANGPQRAKQGGLSTTRCGSRRWGGGAGWGSQARSGPGRAAVTMSRKHRQRRE